MFAATADAQKKKTAKKAVKKPAAAKVWLPRITADKIESDLNGKIIYQVPSEEAGDGWMNWQFSYSQPKQIDILFNDTSGNNSTVEARISAQKAIPNFDGSVDRLRGTARLYYRRSGSAWWLARIENISLRHSDTGSDSRPIYPSYTIPAPAAPAAVSIVPGGVTVPVAAGKYQSYSFRVSNRATVTGRFRAYGGPGNDIEAYILDQDGFTNWSNNHGAPAYYNSGRLTVGTIKTPLNAGTYYLVFNNRYSPRDAKTVEVTIELRNENYGYGEPGGGTYGPYGGPGTVNTVSRVYAPSANPAPPYTPTPNPAPSGGRTIPAPYYDAPYSDVDSYSSEQIFSDTINVRNKKYEAFPFEVKQRGTVKGTFRVLDLSGDIEVFIMTAAEYDKWNRYREAITNYSSGRVTGGKINRSLNTGNYYLVFSNYYSSSGNKTIEANLYVEYLIH